MTLGLPRSPKAPTWTGSAEIHECARLLHAYDDQWWPDYGAVWKWLDAGVHIPTDRATHRPYPHRALMTPPGWLCLDCPMADGVFFEIYGEWPLITVTPMLDLAYGEERFQAWVTEGVLFSI